MCIWSSTSDSLAHSDLGSLVSEQMQSSFYKIEPPPPPCSTSPSLFPKASHVWQDPAQPPGWLVRGVPSAGGQLGRMGSGRALAFQLGQVSPARLPEPLSSFRPSCVLGRGGQAAAVGLISSGNQAKNTREMLWEMLHIVGPKQLVFSLSLSYAHP